MPSTRSPRVTLPIRKVEKPWGREHLPAPFAAPPGKRIGEIWFEPPPELRHLLVKYLFTTEKLSIQVHPSDAQTLEAGLGRQGKEECWLVLAADPGAVLGIGFSRPVTPREIRVAAVDGRMEELMAWHQVRAGDFFYIPAGTVHAIGGGVCLIEVQQNSEITYRLYDYDRPRPLHLNEGISCAHGHPFDERHSRHVPEHGEIALVEGPLFRLVRYDGPLSPEAAARFSGGPLFAIPIEGDVAVRGVRVRPGNCALVCDISDLALAESSLGLVAQPVARNGALE